MSEELQFDKAEYADVSGAVACGECLGMLVETYYTVDDRVLCRGCAEKLRAELQDAGSRVGRVVFAIGAGSAAAVLGSVVYYGVLAFSGYEFALIAIAIGYGVGHSVRWGSSGRGGLAYQGLAVGLTYLSIVTAYVPLLVQSARSSSARQAVSAPGGFQRPVGATLDSPGSVEGVERDAPPTAAKLLLSLAMLIALVCAMPFLGGASNIIGLLIIGFGLFEAWKLNRRVPIEISGPHTVTVSGAA